MNIYGISYSELENYFISKNENKAKAKFVYNNLYRDKINNFNQIKNLNKRIAEMLSEDFTITRLKIADVKKDVDVCKILFELDDKNLVEAVVMMHDYGNALCISTQVGCNMGCKFCESGRLKKIRNLLSHEMVLQVLETEKLLNIKISNITIMGIGEPLDNYDNVIDFISIVSNAQGIEIGPKHITISTCGLIPGIVKLIERTESNCLAVSLHAPNDEIRDKLMPINKTYNIEDLLKVIVKFSQIKNQKVTFEYILIKNINDKKEHVQQLISLLKNIKCKVNLIPYNETGNNLYERSDYSNVKMFHDLLLKANITATIRHEFGSEVKAACGQLRSDAILRKV